MKPLIRALVVLGALSASGCFPMLSAPPMPTLPPRQAPSECLIDCPEVPAPPQAADELGALLWVYDMIDVLGQCRRMHHTCRTSKQPNTQD